MCLLCKHGVPSVMPRTYVKKHRACNPSTGAGDLIEQINYIGKPRFSEKLSLKKEKVESDQGR